MFYLKKSCHIFSILSLIALQVHAQDNHYDAIQLGSKNSILSGASLARWVDQTAVINNPATMLDAVGAGITFNSAAANLEIIKFENGLGVNYDIASTEFRAIPGLIAGDLKPLRREGKTAVGYTMFNRIQDGLRFTKRATADQNIVDDTESPGAEELVGQYTLENYVNESAAGLGWAYKLSDHFNIGITQFFYLRSQKYRESFSVYVFPGQPELSSIDLVASNFDVSLSYFTVMTQTKVGLSWHNGPWGIGLTIMPPSIRIYGQGDMAAEGSLTNIRLPTSSGERKSYLASTYLEKVKTVYHYPFSVGTGVSRKISERVDVSAALNWYAPLDRYVVMDPGETPFIQPPNDSNVLATQQYLQVWAENRAVLNASFSVDWKMKEHVNLMFGYRSDRHYAGGNKDYPGFQLSKKLWDLHHFTFGSQWRIKRSEWILGVQYSRAKDNDFQQSFSFDGITEDNLLQGTLGSGELTSNGLSLLLSFSFNF